MKRMGSSSGFEGIFAKFCGKKPKIFAVVLEKITDFVYNRAKVFIDFP